MVTCGVTERLKGENAMKHRPFKTPSVLVALVILLALNVFTCMTAFAGAAATKDSNVHISGSGYVELIWKSGKSQIFSSNAYAKLGALEIVTIIPSHGWHIDTVLFDGISQDILDEDGFSLFDVQAKNMISVTFLENGGVDDVDSGAYVGAYPDPNVGLIFDNVLADGYVTAYTIGLSLYNQIGDSWEIQTNASFVPDITIYLVCNLTDLPPDVDPYDLTLWRTEVVLGDVNLDGKVDGTDESTIANANPFDYDPELDLNYDGIIDAEDVAICAHNIGLESVWEQLESWVILEDDFVYVYGITEHLSIYGITFWL